jgi:hypothetical protein
MERNIISIENKLEYICKSLDLINLKLESNSEKIDKINKIINEEVSNECKKMGNHINFIEDIYNNVKHPLSFICEKINYYMLNNNDENNIPTLNNIN